MQMTKYIYIYLFVILCIFKYQYLIVAVMVHWHEPINAIVVISTDIRLKFLNFIIKITTSFNISMMVWEATRLPF